ncbi:MAG: 50S ribosomal protein L21 [Rickettsiales bacterium]|nr:50S ribosomal protein L21 [Rickettsiales bacterium]
MYAVIQTCGRQYKISKEDIITIDRISGEKGDKIEIKDVLFTSENGKVQIGTPKIEGAIVKAEIVKHFKSDKIVVFKKKRRKNYRRKHGHSQLLTSIKIKEIKLA